MVSCKDVQCLDASYHPSKDVVLDASVLRKKRGLLKQSMTVLKASLCHC